MSEILDVKPDGQSREPVDMDSFGRPRKLEDRLAAYWIILATRRVHVNVDTLHALAWWDECLAPVLGTEIVSLSWSRGVNGPEASEINQIVQRWFDEGFIWRADFIDYTAPRHEAFMMDNAVFNINFSIDKNSDDTTDSPWFDAIDNFVDGLVGDGCCLDPNLASAIFLSRDIKKIIGMDSTYNLDPWDNVGPAFAISSQRTVLGNMPSEYGVVFTGNGVTRLLKFAMQAADVLGPIWGDMSDKNQKISFAGVFAQHLVSSALGKHPELGENKYLDILNKITVTEVKTGDVVNAEFKIGNAVVGEAMWRNGVYTFDEEFCAKNRISRKEILEKAKQYSDDLNVDIETDRMIVRIVELPKRNYKNKPIHVFLPPSCAEYDDDGTLTTKWNRSSFGILLDFSVKEKYRKRGIGSYILRHVQASGCVLAALPRDISNDAKSLLSWYAAPLPSDSHYKACEIFLLTDDKVGFGERMRHVTIADIPEEKDCDIWSFLYLHDKIHWPTCKMVMRFKN